MMSAPRSILSPLIHLFFLTLPLTEYGLQWVHSPVPLAHPLDDGTAVLLELDVEATSVMLDTDRSIPEADRRDVDQWAPHKGGFDRYFIVNETARREAFTKTAAYVQSLPSHKEAEVVEIEKAEVAK